MQANTKPIKFSEVFREQVFNEEELEKAIYDILEEKDSQEIFEVYLLFKAPIAVENNKRYIQVIPTIEAFAFENYPLFEMWEYLNPSGVEENFKKLHAWISSIFDIRIKFAMVELGKNPDYIRDKIEFLLEIGRKVRQAGVMEFYFHAIDCKINNKTEEWNAKTFSVAEKLKEKRDSAKKIEDMFADFTFKGKKFGKIFYSAYSPIVIPQQESEIIKQGITIADKYFAYHIKPYLTSDKEDFFFLEETLLRTVEKFVIEKGLSKVFT